jgi:hypothetical protein
MAKPNRYGNKPTTERMTDNDDMLKVVIIMMAMTTAIIIAGVLIAGTA